MNTISPILSLVLFFTCLMTCISTFTIPIKHHAPTTRSAQYPSLPSKRNLPPVSSPAASPSLPQLPEPKNLITLDSIVATVMNDEGTEIITLSDTKRPSLSGAPRTVDDMIFELLVFLDALKHKITPDDDAVDKIS